MAPNAEALLVSARVTNETVFLVNIAQLNRGHKICAFPLTFSNPCCKTSIQAVDTKFVWTVSFAREIALCFHLAHSANKGV
jgi:hypothetical protein